MKCAFQASEGSLFHCILYLLTVFQAEDVPDAPRLSTSSQVKDLPFWPRSDTHA